MNKICSKLQETLATDGPRALRDDPGAQEHLADCASCFAFLESAAELEEGLDNLTTLDAPDEVVETLLARPELSEAGDPEEKLDTVPDQLSLWSRGWGAVTRLIRPRPLAWGSALTAALVLVVTVVGYRPSPMVPLGDAGADKNVAEQRSNKMNEESLDAAENDALPRTIGPVGGKVASTEDLRKPVPTSPVLSDNRSLEKAKDGLEAQAARKQLEPERRRVLSDEDKLKNESDRERLRLSAAQRQAELAQRRNAEPKPTELNHQLFDYAAPIDAEPSAHREVDGERTREESPLPARWDALKAAGEVGGQVVDKSGKGMPGVTVTTHSEKAAMQPAGAVTDVDGRFRITALTPEDDYVLRAELPGYAVVEVGPVDLDPGKKTTQNFTLVSSDEVSEKITIVAKGDIVDVATTKTATVFNSEFIEGLPVIGRSYQDVSTPAPGATDSDGEESLAEIEVITAGAGGVIYPQRIEESYVAPVYPDDAQGEALVLLELIIRRDGTVGEVRVLRCDRPGLGFEEAAIEAAKQWRYKPGIADGKPVDVYFTGVVEFAPSSTEQGRMVPPEDPAARVARAFLDDRSSLEGIVFKPANGYWSNTYIPGDPVLRLLHSRVRGRDRSALLPYANTNLRLHDASHTAAQPFDVPESSALAVYMHADRRGIAAESRMLVQVGLKGTPRQGGRRSATNLGVVLDLRGTIPQDAALGMRALINAFNQAKEPGDRFRLFIAGRAGATVVEPEDFRHGYLRVTLDRLLGTEPVPTGSALGITEAVAAAIRSVAANDDPNAPLGSSAVILITFQALGEATSTLVDLAHQSAVAGVPLSVVGTGPTIELSELDRLTLAGQGHRRLLDSPADAASLVDRELSAVSDVIARAVRLRIRLAPGVRLIDVLGSERLDERRAQQVRDAEKSIDLRVARNLGIQADRDEDEEGIQIVIPAFHADDTHVVLLDVVAPGPGPVADVTVRYKDLVFLRNGVGRAGLDLTHDERAGGMLERNVLKNLLSLRLSKALDGAGHAVAAGDPEGAATMLEEFRMLVVGLSRELSGLAGDPDLVNDIAMLDEYRTLLQGGIAANPEHRAHLSDSLLYAALLKLQPRPLEMAS